MTLKNSFHITITGGEEKACVWWMGGWEVTAPLRNSHVILAVGLRITTWQQVKTCIREKIIAIHFSQSPMPLMSTRSNINTFISAWEQQSLCVPGKKRIAHPQTTLDIDTNMLNTLLRCPRHSVQGSGPVLPKNALIFSPTFHHV